MVVVLSDQEHYLRLQISTALLKLLLLIRSCSAVSGRAIRDASDSAKVLDQDLKAINSAENQDSLQDALDKGQVDVKKANAVRQALQRAKSSSSNPTSSTSVSVQAFIRTPHGLVPAPLPTMPPMYHAPPTSAPLPAPYIPAQAQETPSTHLHTSNLSPRQALAYGITPSQHREAEAGVWRIEIGAVQQQVTRMGYTVIGGPVAGQEDSASDSDGYW